jgi:Mg2+/Co2+ transporter CorC
MDMKIIAIIMMLTFSMQLAADYSSLTPQERQELLTAVNMSIEYKLILDNKVAHKIEDAVKVSDDQYRIRLLLLVNKPGGGVREIRRDLYVSIKARESSHWPWYIASGAAGLILGILVTK